MAHFVLTLTFSILFELQTITAKDAWQSLENSKGFPHCQIIIEHVNKSKQAFFCGITASHGRDQANTELVAYFEHVGLWYENLHPWCRRRLLKREGGKRREECSKREPSEIRINKGLLSVIFLSLHAKTNYTNICHSIKYLAARIWKKKPLASMKCVDFAMTEEILRSRLRWLRWHICCEMEIFKKLKSIY